MRCRPNDGAHAETSYHRPTLDAGMTRTTNARIAGFTFLFYIAVAFPAMVLFSRAAGGEGIAAKLADARVVAAHQRKRHAQNRVDWRK